MSEKKITVSEESWIKFLITNIAILKAENKELHAKMNVLLNQLHPDLSQSLEADLSVGRSARYEHELQALADILDLDSESFAAALKSLLN